MKHVYQRKLLAELLKRFEEAEYMKEKAEETGEYSICGRVEESVGPVTPSSTKIMSFPIDSPDQTPHLRFNICITL